MTDQPILSEQEWALVLELLREEQDELPMELHHTDSPRVADELEARKHLVDALVERLRTMPSQ